MNEVRCESQNALLKRLVFLFSTGVVQFLMDSWALSFGGAQHLVAAVSAVKGRYTRGNNESQMGASLDL